MSRKDILLLTDSARREAEEFINQHFDNSTKGWPRLDFTNSVKKDSSSDSGITNSSNIINEN